MKTPPNTIKIKNLSSSARLVRMLPDQRIELHTKENVLMNGIFLRCKKVIFSGTEDDVYIIEPDKKALQCSLNANYFLGQIFVGQEHSLVLYLENPDCIQPSVISVVYPYQLPVDPYTIRMRSNNILEVVCFTSSDKKPDWCWESSWLSNSLLNISYLNNRSSLETINNNPYKVLRHKIDESTHDLIEHHLWFVVNKSRNSQPERNIYLGRLQVEGQDQSLCLDLYFDVKASNNKKTKRTTLVTQPNLIDQFNIHNATTKHKKNVLHTTKKIDIVRLDTRSMKSGCRIVTYIV